MGIASIEPETSSLETFMPIDLASLATSRLSINPSSATFLSPSIFSISGGIDWP